MQRKIRNVVKNYTSTEVKVREATSNDPWGPSSILMSEVSTLTFDVLSRGEVMGIIWKRLNDHGKNWRHVYKSLVLLNFLVRNGSDWVVRECRDNIITIQTLQDFQYTENGLDCGLNIREAAKKLFLFLKDERKLKEERNRTHKSRAGDSRVYSSSIGDLTADQTPSYNQSLNYHKVHQTPQVSTTSHPSSLPKQKTIPVNIGNGGGGDDDDDDDLKIAMALSREEHNEEIQKRRNDEVRLKMALEESKKTAQLDTQRSTKVYAPSLIDQEDPWDNNHHDHHPPPHPIDNPWNITNDDASISYSIVNKVPANLNLLGGLTDEGVESSFNSQSHLKTKSRDDEFDEIINRSALQEDFNGVSINNSGNDWLKPLTNQGAFNISKSNSMGDLLNDLLSPINNNNDILNNNNDNNNLLNFSEDNSNVKSKKKTAEEFLGDNAKLVNLDELVVMPVKSESNNPFAMTTTLPNKPPPNPFNINKQPVKVPLNQLQTSNYPISNHPILNNSTYNHPTSAHPISNYSIPLIDPQFFPQVSNLPPRLPQQPPIAFNNQFNPFL